MWLLKLLSLFPTRVLYIFSDLLFLLLYYIVRYRYKTVRQNISQSFPEKSEAEHRQIIRQWYTQFCDLIFETVRLMSISRAELQRRVQFKNLDLLTSKIAHGQSVLALTTHHCNWEWLLNATAASVSFPIDAVYKPLSNPLGASFMQQIRGRFGASPVAMNMVLREIIRRKGHEQHVVAMVADQRPFGNLPEHYYWADFLGRETAFYIGAEKIARKTNFPVLFIGMRPGAKRGHYEVFFEEIALPPYHEYYPNAILDKYIALSEELIRQYPANYLWSHDRWRDQRPWHQTSAAHSE
ncbi:lysophospholipid acyltransferase family protein [Eisenibacter elegans]|jgi:KDO2-lipid IV(A) lauroyltransferase|uniref:lysophospholipid acyltransferase family protein n=1 Tax=Eisenibacter elegans TaxID=997 RepID=UPI000687BC70|nr:lysophospholipid acyltransferase family protein [Eisenibacter elegans]